MADHQSSARQSTTDRSTSGSLSRGSGGIAWLVVGLLIGVTLAVGGQSLVNRIQPAPIQIVPPGPTSTPAATVTPAPILVYVSGQVVSPDVYQLPFGSIVKQAVDAAGGFTASANTSVVNLAQRLSDGTQVYIPSVDETLSASNPVVRSPNASLQQGVTAPVAVSGTLININTAARDELEALPGIGSTLAQRIIDYREELGPFTGIEELMNVSGIGSATFDKLKDLVTVE